MLIVSYSGYGGFWGNVIVISLVVREVSFLLLVAALPLDGVASMTLSIEEPSE